MFFFGKKSQKKYQAKEAEIKAIRNDTFRAIEKARKSTEKLADFLEDEGVTNLIFLATGGDHRGKRKNK